jgi:uncharacterized membrane protein
MDIVKPFKDAWEIYIKNFIVIILAAIIVGILSVITLGILAIPLHVGLLMLFVKAKRGASVVLNDIFAPISKFVTLLFGGSWISILVAIGLVLLILPGLCWLSWWMYALLFIYDKGLGIGAGMRASKEIVRKNNLWLHLVFLLVVGFIMNLGNFIPPYGILLNLMLWPLALGALACAYAEEAK